MRFFIYLLVSILTINSSFSQKATLKGKLTDSSGKQSFENASISLLDIKDSTLEEFTLAKFGGSFEFKNVSVGSYLLQISYQGFATETRRVNLTKDNPDMDLGTIQLMPLSKDLAAVTVTSNPIVIRKDTVEYNAGSFKTKPNAVVEDVLKKMPGIQVDKDGNVKAHGEDVQRVLVDGKRFFGDDAKMATKNLPSDVVDKIQVFDAQSDQSVFSGFDDGTRTKTINIVTKKDKRKGLFGKASTGFGTDQERTLNDHSANLNYFNNGKQFTFTGSANNVNKQNFSVQDALGALGGGGGGGGGMRSGGVFSSIQNLIGSGSGNGIVNTWSGGLNFGQDWGSRSNSLNSSGFYNAQRTNKNTKSFTETFRSSNTDSSILSDEDNNSTTRNRNFRLNFNLEKPLDSHNINAIVVRSNFSLQNTDKSNYQLTNTRNKFKTALLNTAATTGSNNNGYNGNLDVTFRHRFVKKGRTFSINTSISGNNNKGDGENYSENIDYQKNRYDTIDQRYNSNSYSHTFAATLSYTEPIGKYSQIEIAVNNNMQTSESKKYTYAFDNLTKDYTTSVANLTNSFTNEYTSQRATLSYRLNKEKFNFTVGNGVQWGNLNSLNKTTNITIDRNYINVFPTANFNYNFSKTENMRVNYTGRTSQPSVSQLQPVVDNSNPLNIRSGNPDLNQRFTHNLRAFYHSFDMFSQRIIVAMANVSVTQNDIQNSITVLPSGRQITQPVNINGTYNATAFFNYGFPLKKPKSNLNLGLNANFSQSQGLINGESNYNRNQMYGANIIWTTNLKEKWDINFTSNSSYNIAKYTLQPNLDANFFSQYLSAELTYYTKSGWQFSTDFDYTQLSGRTSGYNTSIPLWNASISKQMFKDKAGELKLYVFDLLKQNQSIDRSVTSTYIQDSRTQVLTQYVMLSFSYNLRKFKGQGMKGGERMEMRSFKFGPGGGGGRHGGGFGRD